MNSEIFGFLSIILTIFIWGTWLIFSRKASNELSNPFFENLLITFWALICNSLIFLFSLFYLWVSFEISLFLFPFLSWILWAFAWLFAFISIAKIWVWKAMSIWAPSGMLVSFLWWVLYYNEFSWNFLYATAAITLIIIWVVTVIQVRNNNENSKIVFSGVIFAFLASLIWWGTYLVPIKELSTQISPFITLFPLSVWMFFGALWIFLVNSKKKNYSIKDIVKVRLIILSGFMWWVWNLFAIISVMSIGMGKAYPLAELCGIVNALFAIFVLKEIRDKNKISLFLLATTISFIWGIWLSILKI